MANLPQPKSILKKLASTTPTPRRPDARQVAIEHARILQQRKDMEARILDDIILLSEYPKHTADPEHPDPRDIDDFKSRVRLFQPSDYDALITERNTNDLCGYTMCPRQRRDTGGGGQWTLGPGGQIVSRAEVERWCSRACARRALYVKVQLNETAAWERAGIPDIEIELHDEDKNKGKANANASASASDNADPVDQTTHKMGEMKLQDQRQAAQDSAALALERGDRQDASPGVKVSLRERQNVQPPKDTAMEDWDVDSHLLVDNYKPKTGDSSKT